MRNRQSDENVRFLIEKAEIKTSAATYRALISLITVLLFRIRESKPQLYGFHRNKFKESSIDILIRQKIAIDVAIIKFPF